MSGDNKINILLVDDQPAKLLSYEVMLEALDENLIKVSSAKDALEVLLKTEIAVILVDVCMPELDGFELAAMIRDHPRFKRTAIVFISAIHISEADSLRGYDAGAVDYVPVPVVPEVLRAKVRVFVDLYRKTRQLEELNTELERRVAERTAALEASAARLIESERSRSLALAAGNMGSWEYDFAEHRWHVDDGQYRIFGLDPGTSPDQPELIRSLFHPEDWDRLVATVEQATVEHNTFRSELRIVRITGEVRWCEVAAAASFDDNGLLQRVSGVTIDITERKEAEERQNLLAREVDHRARNALAVVQAIVRLGKAPDVQSYMAGVEGRIRALAVTHDLLSKSRWQGAEIVRLIGEEMAPYRNVSEKRVTIDGPALVLPPDKAQTVAMTVHELATNAAKYGALSVPAGSVRISWAVKDDKLCLTWRECGGPKVTTPKTRGFGTKIIVASVNASMGERVAFDWLPDGLRCELVLNGVRAKSDVPLPPVPVTRGRRPDSKAVTNGKALANGKAVANGNGATRNVLLVEDEALVGLLTGDLLTRMGYTVIGPCTDLDQAIAAANTNSFDGAILDVNLSGRPVFPLAASLLDRNIPFIFTTGYEKNAIEPDFGNVPILQKPIAVEDLESALKGMLAEA